MTAASGRGEDLIARGRAPSVEHPDVGAEVKPEGRVGDLAVDLELCRLGPPGLDLADVLRQERDEAARAVDADVYPAVGPVDEDLRGPWMAGAHDERLASRDLERPCDAERA